MQDEPYERYIAAFRTLIENHGVNAAVYVLERAIALELQEEGLFDSERKKMRIASADTYKLYFKLEKL